MYENYFQNKCTILLGNMCDLTKGRKITEEEGRNFAELYNMKHFETSAKTMKNVNESFNYLILQILENKKIKKEVINIFI